MTSKWIRRQAKQDKARYGMRMDGAGLKSTPTGALYEYSYTLKHVGEWRLTAKNKEQAVRMLRRLVPRAFKGTVNYRTVQEVR